MCSYYFSSVWVAEWPPFGTELLTRLTICYLCILTIFYLRFGFDGWIWVLIVSVPDLCILFTFIFNNEINGITYFRFLRRCKLLLASNAS